MPENQNLRERLQQLLSRKKSRKYYAHQLGVTEEEIKAEMEAIRNIDANQILEYTCQLEETVLKLEEDIKRGVGELTLKSKEEIKTLEELIEKGKIDTEKWNIDRYVQNYWGNGDQPHWQVKAYLSQKTKEQNFHKEFLDFLKTYKPLISSEDTTGGNWDYMHSPACLIINKQDEHLNKLDVNGRNSMEHRFNRTYGKTKYILENARNVNLLEKIVYVIGSDEFNSEWTKATTRGTPQENMLPYQEAFMNICDYEVRMVELLRKYSDHIHIMYVPGNHDEYVGWHLIHWLQAVYRDNPSVVFDISPKYTKFISFYKSAMMFNHGDAIKPEKLVGMFPVLYKEKWSEAENYYVFTGDKHHEVSKDINGIKFYQLPALSGAKSLWDEKNGHTCSPPELTAFLIEKEQGMTAIYKQKL